MTMTAEMRRKKSQAEKPIRLDGDTAAQVRRGFGIDPSRLELGESEAVRAMGARAVAKGNVIQFAPGEFAPDTREGMETLGHELEHVRGQAAGEVPMTGGLLEQPIYEAAADRAGEAFAAGSLYSAKPVSPLSGAAAQTAPAQGIFGRGRKKRRAMASAAVDEQFSQRDNSFRAQAGPRGSRFWDALQMEADQRFLDIQDTIQNEEEKSALHRTEYSKYYSREQLKQLSKIVLDVKALARCSHEYNQAKRRRQHYQDIIDGIQSKGELSKQDQAEIAYCQEKMQELYEDSMAGPESQYGQFFSGGQEGSSPEEVNGRALRGEYTDSGATLLRMYLDPNADISCLYDLGDQAGPIPQELRELPWEHKETGRRVMKNMVGPDFDFDKGYGEKFSLMNDLPAPGPRRIPGMAESPQAPTDLLPPLPADTHDEVAEQVSPAEPAPEPAASDMDSRYVSPGYLSAKYWKTGATEPMSERQQEVMSRWLGTDGGGSAPDAEEGETAEITDVSRPLQKVPSYNPIPIVTPEAREPAPELLGSRVPKYQPPQWSGGGRGFNPIPILTEADRTPDYQSEPEPQSEPPAAPAPAKKKKGNWLTRLFSRKG